VYNEGDSFGSDSAEKRGQFVGIAEHVGHAITLKSSLRTLSRLSTILMLMLPLTMPWLICVLMVSALVT